MTTETVHVPDIACAHCTRTIEREMMELEGMRRVSADLDSKRVTFTYEAPLTPAKIHAAMEEIGYPVIEGLGTNRSA
ncbi:MAG: heavy-metal-associated domain-containing protein [Chloroflexota bacterium]|nr:heavy-metal-associated domain-containing protein [Chloroflexota bacterium]